MPEVPLADAQTYPLWLNGVLFAGAAALVWFAGVRLTRCIDAVARRTGMGQAFAGMLLLGGITSLPEVANVTTSALNAVPMLGINNLLGSAAINVLLLALADAAIGRQAVTSIVGHASTLMMAALCMMVLVLVGAIVTIGDVALDGFGIGSAAICAASLASFKIATGYEARAPWRLRNEEVSGGSKEGAEDASAGLGTLWAWTALHGSAIFAAGYALSQTGDAIAVQTGLGSALVGFALIGVATSMPELSTIVTALRMRKPELAFGQVLGTNFINLTLILLADLVYAGGPVINELGRFEVISALLGATLIGIFMVGLLEHRDRTIWRMGHDSAAVIATFGLGLVLLSFISGGQPTG